MKTLIFLPEGSPNNDLLLALAKRLRHLGHGTICMNPQYHRPEEMYAGMDVLLADESGRGINALADYRERERAPGVKYVKRVVVVDESSELQAVLDDLLAEHPKEVPALEGLPTAAPLVHAEPHVAFDGLPAMAGDDLLKPSPLERSDVRPQGRKGK